MKTPRELVLLYYPNAKAVNIGSKSGGRYYNILSDKTYLGQGKSSKAAWKAAYRNLNS